MSDVILWLIIAAAALVGEVLTTSFFLIFFTVGAAVAFLLAVFTGASIELEAVVFLAISFATMLILRPPLVQRLALHRSSGYRSTDGIVGKKGVVTRMIRPGMSGTVQIGSGEYWTAEAVYSNRELPEGTPVEVVATRGVTALVDPLDDEPRELKESS